MNPIIESYQKELALKNSIIAAQRNLITRYEDKVIANLQTQISLLEQQRAADSELLTIEGEEWQLKVKKAKRRRIVIGPFAGYTVDLDGAIEPTFGIGVSYALLKF